jgi:hypothetical protein
MLVEGNIYPIDPTIYPKPKEPKLWNRVEGTVYEPTYYPKSNEALSMELYTPVIIYVNIDSGDPSEEIRYLDYIYGYTHRFDTYINGDKYYIYKLKASALSYVLENFSLEYIVENFTTTRILLNG